MKIILGFILIFNLIGSTSVTAEPIDWAKYEGKITPELIDEVTRLITARLNDTPPAAIQSLAATPVANYFTAPNGQLLNEPDRAGLLRQAARLHNFQEGATSGASKGLFNGFVEQKLKPFIAKMSFVGGGANAVRSQMTIEDLVVVQKLSFLAKSKNFLHHARSLIDGPHLRGASQNALRLVIIATVAYSAYEFSSVIQEIAKQGGASAGFTIKFALSSAVLACVINPTIQFINKALRPLTAKAEIKMNSIYNKGETFLNWWIPWFYKSSQAESPASKIDATLNQDGTRGGVRFGGQTGADQHDNMTRMLSEWAAFNLQFPKGYRDAQAGGRNMQVGHSNDEIFANTLIKGIENELLNYRNLEELILNPYKTLVIDSEKREILVEAFDDYRRRSEAIMAQSYLEAADEGKLVKEWDAMENSLRANGFSERDIRELNLAQARKAKAIEELATVLAVNELRHFAMKEYRMIGGFMDAYMTAFQNGLHVNDKVQKYQSQVAVQQVKMGFSNSSAPATVPPKDSASTVTSGAGSIQCSEILGRRLPWNQ